MPYKATINCINLIFGMIEILETYSSTNIAKQSLGMTC